MFLVEKFCKILYFTCPSAYMFHGEFEPTTVPWKGRIQKARFWIVSSLSMLHSAKSIRYSTIRQSEDERSDVNFSIVKGHRLTQGSTRFLYVRLTGLKYDRLGELIRIIRRATTHIQPTWLDNALPVFLFIESILEAFLDSFFVGFSLSDWSLNTVIGERSFQIGAAVLMWGNSSESNVEQVNNLYEKFGENLTAATWGLGTAGMVMHIFACLHDIAIRNLVLLSCITMFRLTTTFREDLAADDENNRRRIWDKFVELKALSAAISDAFGTLLVFLHIQNLTYMAIVLAKFASGIDISFYLLNDAFRLWKLKAYKTQNYVTINGEYVNLSNITEELAINPIGIGSGYFLVDINFIIKFLGLLMSYFILRLQFEEKMRQ